LRGYVAIPVALAAASTAGLLLCAALGWNPHRPAMLAAATVMLVACAAGLMILPLVRPRTHTAVAQAALAGMSLHLFIALAIGGVVYLTAFAPQTPFAYWLLLDYWVTLPLIAAVFIRAMRSAAIQHGM
jgi:hypothetical protein